MTWEFRDSKRAQPLYGNLLYCFPPYLLTVIISHWYFFPLHSRSIFIRAILFSVITLASIKSFFFSAALIFSLQGLTDYSFLSFFPPSPLPFALRSVSSSYGNCIGYLPSLFSEPFVFCLLTQVCIQNFPAFFPAPGFERSLPPSDLQYQLLFENWFSSAKSFVKINWWIVKHSLKAFSYRMLSALWACSPLWRGEVAHEYCPQCFLLWGRCVLNPQGRARSNLSSGWAVAQKFKRNSVSFRRGCPLKAQFQSCFWSQK